MRLHNDADTFVAFQERLATAIIEELDEHVSALRLSAKRREELVTTAAFRVCSLVDGICDIGTVKRKPVFPFLMFAYDIQDGMEVRSVLTNGGTSYMHEAVHELAALFYRRKSRRMAKKSSR